MRRKYTKPSMSIDMFEANEYIAACYKIKCNVPNGTGYIERNGEDGYQRGDEYLASGYGCGVWHVGVQLDAPPTNNAMWDPKRGKEYPVFHWTQGNGNSGHHFSKVSDTQWETNPNAS